MAIDYSTLNESQHEAVFCTKGPLLVLAGAGSGKTRVLTYRIAHMIEDEDVSPYEILAITFTNKAAKEMRDRLDSLLGIRARGMWVMTFHAFCVRVLRANAQLLGYSPNFTIYDDSDSKTLVKNIMNALDVDDRTCPLKGIRARISKAKNELQSPEDFELMAGKMNEKQAARVYYELRTRLKAANAMDFDDLLYNTYVLFRDFPDALAAYQDRFHKILIDEYQDTNKAQYEITSFLARRDHDIMVVGDDDQSIYSWRGADIRNILGFEKDYPEARVVKLEENYRSTGHILDAANAVIANNPERKSKRLYTNAGEGDQVNFYLAADERDEGRWIASEVERLVAQGIPRSHMAIFYRANAQSRAVEDMLMRAGEPYRIVGGTRFFDRAEIRDVTAYLSVIVNPADDISAQRIINTPKRGIGRTTVEKIAFDARENGLTFMQAVNAAIRDEAQYNAGTRAKLSSFIDVIENAKGYVGDLRPLIEHIVEATGLIHALEAEDTDEARARIENIREFFGVVQEYVDTHNDDDVPDDAPGAQSGATRSELDVFMEWLALRTDLDNVIEDDDCLTLMTIHSAKGLEFDVVFVAGMEEGLFPHMASLIESPDAAEERRLAYVAITRAKKRLYLTAARERHLFGSRSANPVSRYVGEIPDEHLKAIGLGSEGMSGFGYAKRGDRHSTYGSGTGTYARTQRGGTVPIGAHAATRSSKSSAIPTGNKRSSVRPSAEASSGHNIAMEQTRVGASAKSRVKYEPGDAVNHKTWGRGVVKEDKGDRVVIVFETKGEKLLLKEYAPIVKIG